jgi:D-alanyl-D-alanine carboxypeptidase/D-alanyl-D-alanine-endopeptidase (penicillin-binding protein 4)
VTTRRAFVLLAAVALVLGLTPAAMAQDPTAPTTSVVSVEATPSLGTPVLSPRRAPGVLLDGLADRRLAEQLAPLVAELPPTSCLVVAEAGRPVFVHQAELPLVPASTMKLPMAAAVEDALGTSTPLVTTVRAAGQPTGGVVDGDLHLVGGGDPLLTTDGYLVALQDRDLRLTSSLAELADAVVATGVTEVRGSVVGTDDRYDDRRWVDSWPERYRRQDTVGPLSALIVNDGNTGYSESPSVPSSQRQPGDPPALAAATLTTLLTERGVSVVGEARSGTAPDGLVDIARHDSPQVGEILTDLLRYSDNTSAELLTKELDVATGGRGSTDGGTQAVRSHLVELGVDDSGAVLVDGSGLDVGNRLSCGQLTGVLDGVPAESVLRTGLSVSGEIGTLRQRMVGSLAEGRVHAKTGTLNTSYALAGYVDTLPGSVLTFAIIANIPPEGAPQVGTGQQDQLAQILVGYPSTPDPATLAPLPPG